MGSRYREKMLDGTRKINKIFMPCSWNLAKGCHAKCKKNCALLFPRKVFTCSREITPKA